MYTPATSYPALNYFQWSTLAAPNPRLASPISATDTTLVFTSAPLDHTGAVITGNFLMGIKNDDSYVETVYVAAGAMSVDGLTATGVVRGIRLEGTDYTTGDPTLASSFNQDSPVFCNISAVIEGLTTGVLKGTIATNGLGFIIGDGTATNGTISHKDATGTHGFIRKNPTDGKVEYSDDGTNWVSIDSATASNLVVVSNADTTPSTLDAKITVTGSGITKSIVNPGANETLNFAMTANQVVDVTYTAGEALTANYPVSKTLTDDTVELTVVNDLNTGGGETSWATTGVDCVRACQAAANKVAVFYRDTTNSLGKVVIGTVDPSTKTPTFGNPVSLGFDVGSTSICYMADDKIAIAYRKVSDNKTYVQVATISGTVPAPGIPADTGSGNSASAQGSTAITCINTDKLATAIRTTNDANKGYARAYAVTGTMIAGDAPVTFLTTGAANAVSNIAIAKAATDKFVVFCRNEGDTNKGKGALGVVSGTAITMATEVEIDANASSEFSASQVSTGDSGAGIVTWIGGASGYVMSRCFTVTGLTLAYPATAQTVNAAAALTPRVIWGSWNGTGALHTAFVVYEESGTSDGKFNKLILDAGAGTIVPSAQYVLNGTTSNLAQTAIAKVNGNNKFVICYKDEADSNKGNAEVFQEYDNTATCRGFAQSSVLSGASVVVREKGLAASGGLTAGQVCYVGSATGGVMSSTNGSGVQAGIAKSASLIDVDIQRIGKPMVKTIFTSSGTWFKPISKNLNYIEVEVQAAGAAGSSGGSSASGDAGGAGGYARKLITAATLVGVEAVTVTASTTAAFGAYLSAAAGSGRTGGAGTGGDINIKGGDGGKGGGNGTSGIYCCNGGNCPLGTGGGAAISGLNGGDGGGYGGGGGGGYTASGNGGAAAPAVVIVREYYL